MTKKYIKPGTTIYTINLSKSFMLLPASQSTEADYSELEGFQQVTGTADDAEGEFSRSGNNHTVWDNIW